MVRRQVQSSLAVILTVFAFKCTIYHTVMKIQLEMHNTPCICKLCIVQCQSKQIAARHLLRIMQRIGPFAFAFACLLACCVLHLGKL
jgi:heme/copper-type cytochrome/quinol oxidase subunit 4